jgi:hypothetical protein
MLSCVVNSRRPARPNSTFHSSAVSLCSFSSPPHFHTSLPDIFSSCDENPVTASPSESAFTNRDAHNSFRICFCENCRVSLALCSFFSLFVPRVFHNSFPVSRIRTLSKNCRVSPSLPTCEPSDLETCQPLSGLSPFFSHSCKLFCPRQKLNSFLFNPLQTLFPKHPGWGGTHRRGSSRFTPPRTSRCPSGVPRLFFHKSPVTSHLFTGCPAPSRMLRFGVP